MHENNLHLAVYNFPKLRKKYLPLKKFVFTNKHGIETVDFSSPKVVKAVNTALLMTYYGINYWSFSDENLCPPIPGRSDYIHHLADLLKVSSIKKNVQVLDIGVGATCIYPILGNAIYNWKFIGTDIDENSLYSSQKIINTNKLNDFISLRKQENKGNILHGIIHENDKFSVSMCNPPFYASEQDAYKATTKKLKGLGILGTSRNFSGISSELWYKGGEKAFLHNYLYQSAQFKNQCYWFTSLVSKKENLKGMYDSLKVLNATKIKTINMKQGNKISRFVVWTFLTYEEQKLWNLK